MRLCYNWNLLSRGNVTVNNEIVVSLGQGDKRAWELSWAFSKLACIYRLN